ncbi:hypothetical protein KHQ81_00520 [Mycoplasmatota bacterium]|nr:hypothetical protein KHQ81_00520 [Mycoplasmatota bacterium]
MATRGRNNTLSIIVWFLGLLGCVGYIDYFYPLGFFPLVVPLLFWLFGSKFTKMHCKVYFNVLLTAVIIHVVGTVIDQLLLLFKVDIFRFMYLGLIYFSILCLFGLIAALNNKKYRPELVVHVF